MSCSARISNLLYLCTVAFILAGIFACQHDPAIILVDDDMMPGDTTVIDTTIIDPDTSQTNTPCEPDIVYFELQILPILKSNCAFSGCHDDASAQDGVILTSYQSVIATADVEPFNLDDSEIYEVLVHTDEAERMPPPPTARLSSAQINLIAKWILQGGEDRQCNPDIGNCDTTAVSFSQTIQPVIADHCQGCHGGATPAGGIRLSDYEGIKTVALDGRLAGAISWTDGFEPMPQGGDKLNDCFISQLNAWIENGAPQN